MSKNIYYRVVSLALLVFVSSCKQEEKRPPLPTDGFYNNEEGSPAYAMIAGAEKSIDIEVYQMSDTDFMLAVHDAIKRGVKVRLVKDAMPLGDKCNVFESINVKDEANCVALKNLVSEIQSSGGQAVPFNKPELCAGGETQYCFMHGKMIIADASVAMISTGNFNGSNLCNIKADPEKCNRDYSFVTRDVGVLPVLSKVFEMDLQAKRYDLQAMLTPEVSDKLTVSPHSLDPILAFIKSAKTSIKIQNQYLKEININRALQEMSAKGVHVEVTLASSCSFGKPKENEIKNISRIFNDFDSSGIKSKMFTVQNMVKGKPGYMHAKAIVVDDSRAWVGSVNGSKSAFSINREFGLFFSDPDSVRKLKGVMESDFANPGTETWQESLQCLKDDIKNISHE